jgi:2-hydroxy-3-keto-5-methylthiopentenyl-1-phosphate phosphatase
LPLKVLSGGLDFCIRHFLDRDDWLKFLTVYAPESKFTGNGYSLTFPRLRSSSSTNFKDDLVRHEKGNGARVVFVGDGFGDLPAAKESDFAFAIKGSRLAELCRQLNVPHDEIDDFNEVIDALRHGIQHIQ